MRLLLYEALLASTMPDDNGRVVDARFFLQAADEKDPTSPHLYSLEVVLGSHYPELYLEGMSEDHPKVDPVLVIPDENAEDPGLVEYVSRVFLDPRDPLGVNRIGSFLVRVEGDDAANHDR